MLSLSVESSPSRLSISLCYPFSSEDEFESFIFHLPKWFYDNCLSYQSFAQSCFKFSVPISFLNEHLPCNVLPIRFLGDLIIETLSQVNQCSSVY